MGSVFLKLAMIYHGTQKENCMEVRFLHPGIVIITTVSNTGWSPRSVAISFLRYKMSGLDEFLSIILPRALLTLLRMSGGVHQLLCGSVFQSVVPCLASRGTC